MATDTRSAGIALLLSLTIVLGVSAAGRWYYDQKVAQTQETEQIAADIR